MARLAFDIEGALTGTNQTVALGAAAIAANANAQILIVNDSDSKVTGSITVPAGTQVGGGGDGVDYPYEVAAKSYAFASLVKTGTTAANLTLMANERGGMTSHRTSAQVGEFVYLVRAN